MKVAELHSLALPKFRDALARVVLLPSLVFIVVIVVGAFLTVWRAGSSLEELNAKLAQSIGRQAQSLWNGRESQLRQLAILAEGMGSTLKLEAKLAQEFDSVYWFDLEDRLVDSWPGGPKAKVPSAAVTLLERLANERAPVWSGMPRSEAGSHTGWGVEQNRVRLVGFLNNARMITDIETLVTGSELSLGLLDGKGTLLSGRIPQNFIQQNARHPEQTWVYSDMVTETWSQVSVWKLGNHAWTVLLSRPLADIDSALLIYLVVVPVLLVVMGFVLAYLGGLNRQLFRALQSLKNETRRITLGDYSEKLTRTSYQDLNEILQDFESMRESVWLRQQDLKDSEYRFRRMFEEAAIGILHTTFTGQPLDLNLALARMLGYSTPQEALEHIKNVTTELYVRPEEYEAILQMLIGTAQGRSQITTEFFTRHKKILIVNNHLGRVFDTHRNEFILESFIEDVTEIKRAEKAILEINIDLERKVADRTRHLEQTLENLKLAQAQLVRSEKLAALGQLIAGIAHEINTPLGAISASNNNIGSLLKKVLEGLPRLLQLLGDEQKASFFQMYEHSYRGVEVIPSSQLRQKRKQAATFLDAAGVASDEEVIDFLAELDLTTHLESYLSLLVEPVGREAVRMVYEMISLEKSCLVIDQASDKAAKVIGALRTFTHEEQHKEFRQVDLRENLESVLTLFQSRLRHGVELRKNFGTVFVWGYADRLAQVWTNLVANALQAMDYKGLLEMETLEKHDMVLVVIRDSGPGIPDNIRDRIFEPFFTTKSAGEGSGLGLDLCQRFVEEHHGRILVESTPGRTQFTVELPLASPDLTGLPSR